MCTRSIWPDANGAVLVGRNMDFRADTGTNLWVFPKGMSRDDGLGGKISWESKYGSLVASGHDLMTVDGFNEPGLGAHLLWLAESNYGEPDSSRPALALSVWMQYLLDNFSTVAEAVAWMEETQVQIVAQNLPGTDDPVTLHLALDDATGDSAIVQYLDGNPEIWHDRSYTVMTNSPPFAEQLERVKKIEGLGGDEPLLGGTDSDQRFARAVYYTNSLPDPKSTTEAVASILSVMRNVSQPFRNPDPDKPYASQTVWRTVMDLTNRFFVFESTTRPNIVWVRMDELDLAEGAPTLKLDLVGDTGLDGGLVGDVTSDFTESEPMRFLPAG